MYGLKWLHFVVLPVDSVEGWMQIALLWNSVVANAQVSELILSHLAVALSAVRVSSCCILQAAVVEGKVARFWISQLFCTTLKAELQSFSNVKMIVTQLLFLMFLSSFLKLLLSGIIHLCCYFANIISVLKWMSKKGIYCSHAILVKAQGSASSSVLQGL